MWWHDGRQRSGFPHVFPFPNFHPPPQTFPSGSGPQLQMVTRGNHLENLNFRTRESCNATTVYCTQWSFTTGLSFAVLDRGQPSLDRTKVSTGLFKLWFRCWVRKLGHTGNLKAIHPSRLFSVSWNTFKFRVNSSRTHTGLFSFAVFQVRARFYILQNIFLCRKKFVEEHCISYGYFTIKVHCWWKTFNVKQQQQQQQ